MKKASIPFMMNLLKSLILFVVFIIIVIGFTQTMLPKEKDFNIREAEVAGQFYPKNPDTLRSDVNNYIQNSNNAFLLGDVKAIIVPHAGYQYSAQVAAKAYKQLSKYKNVIIIASNHNEKAKFNGISVANYSHYETPLGKVKVSQITKELLKKDLFTFSKEVHESHIIEVQLPFLQETQTEFEIIPLVTNYLTQEQVKAVAKILNDYIDEETLIVISTDLSHYKKYEEANIIDKICTSSIKDNEYDCEACGYYALLILQELANQNNWQPQFLDYKNSGDTAGNKESVVGYTSFVFTKDNSLSKAEKDFLLIMAREKLNSIYSGEKFSIDETKLTLNIKKVQGCFITINKNNNLRGCIGHILPQKPLYECVIGNIENAALRDSRFNPVTEDELNDLEIEISVLSVPKESSLEIITPFQDGVVLKRGLKQATYLPQVWNQISNKDSFLSSLCKKANLDEDCYEDKITRFSTYQADIFS